MQRLRAEIACGERSPGERMPSIRSLAGELGVNVNTVARAYAELVRDGTILSRPGGGTFVASGSGGPLQAERRAEQLRSIVADAVLRSLSLGYASDEIEQAVRDQLEVWRAASKRSSPRGASSAGSGTILFAGSHDLALELLATRLRYRASPIDLQLAFTGSTAGLLALVLDQAQIAGCHLGDVREDGIDGQLERLFTGRSITRVTLAHRQQGLMVPPGNPRGLREVRDLAMPGVTVGLRQAGSGTRLLLERALADAGVRLSPGEHLVLSTHGEVAAAVAEGSVDAGLGILAAARTYGLDFLPLAWERYELVMPTELVERPATAGLLETLRSGDFKAVMTDLGGYDTSETGRETRIGVTWEQG
jgi:molybdate-binding protein/DNA-binding transcriptional regulator YhcF (GntR family)